MNLENAVKFHFAKSTQINDTPRATSSETLTGTDVMAAMGMTQSRAELGYSAFLGKMEISSNDRDKAIELLTQYALEHCDKVAALRKLENDIKSKVMQVLATFAFADYARSAASTRTCDCCKGEKFIEAERVTMKFIGQPKLTERRELVKVLCHKCKGAGVISNSCQCNGKGVVLDKEKTILQGGVPAYKTCGRCHGRGYSRLLPDSVRKYICATVIDVPETTWRRSYKDFFESLVSECIKQEEYANQMLRKVTK
ncbi:antitermination protein [Citrobacter sp. 50677481]|uniref:antitermination protein n=1 Tax=Citrobacter sp. 50677481 TaxID=1736699 RepID=UPI0007420F8F|nr:antitermination protein [Citrobacter sp. 50677481]KSY33579.1 antitermination protein [Citrobacter sp. 50677481]HCQ7755513.1 antitermination protein [Citrobacter sedlakii]